MKWHGIFPDISPLCDKCESTEADLLHSFAMCTRLHDFWVDNYSLFSKIFKVQMRPEPVLIILGISDVSRSSRVTQQLLLSYGLITAKKLILMCCKGKEVPTLKRLLMELTDTLYLEKIRYSETEQFEKIWRPLLSFLEKERAS